MTTTRQIITQEGNDFFTGGRRIFQSKLCPIPATEDGKRLARGQFEIWAQRQELSYCYRGDRTSGTQIRVDDARNEALLNALKSLAGYKFIMFGYHAAQWVLLNRVSATKRPNPFRALVHQARKMIGDSP